MKMAESMNQLLLSLESPRWKHCVPSDACAVLASAGNYLLRSSPELDEHDWQAAMTLLRLYNSIDNER